jgi:type II secretory pathway pseudopilin PulG
MSKQKGLTLLEVAICIISVGLTILVGASGMVSAMKNTKQKETMLKMRNMAHAMQSFTKKYGGYPSVSYTGDPSVTWPLIRNRHGVPVVVPVLIGHVPIKDGWGSPFSFISGPDGSIIQPKLGEPVAVHFAIYSMGSDGVCGRESDNSVPGNVVAAMWCNEPPIAMGTIHTHCYQSDIVWADKSFCQAPDGPQVNCF